MPDWFYRTVTQPLFFQLPAVRARDLALGFMSRLARVPFGPAAIDFLGHMRADPRLRQTFLGIDFPTAVGLGPGLDARGVAWPALARFGVPLGLHLRQASTTAAIAPRGEKNSAVRPSLEETPSAVWHGGCLPVSRSIGGIA